MKRALTLNREVEEIIRANIKEYEEQNRFVRPVGKRMFRQGTDLKVEQWLELTQKMTSRFERARADAKAWQAVINLASMESYLDHLRHMGGYIIKQEGDARGWIRAPAQL